MATRSTEGSPLPVPEWGGLPPEDILFGRSAAMQSVRHAAAKIAPSDVPVLVEGANGTGKEVLARWIHQRSSRSSHAFVKVNCPAIPSQLMESELFGYERGAFTGAVARKPGRLELADGGSLFLDEIAELGPELQAKLLQLLQDGQFSRIGSLTDVRIQVRVICATSKQLEREVEESRFRRDVFYRINIAQIRLPSLSERLEDVPALAQYFVDFYSAKHLLEAPPLRPTVLRLMQKHPWPGNIRELQNLMERYTILGSEEPILEELRGATARRNGLSAAAMETPTAKGLKKVARQTVRDFERKLILDALISQRWNRKLAAKELGISYRTLFYKLRQAGLAPRRESV